MLPVLLISFSLLAVVIKYLKSREKTHYIQYVNKDLQEYYNRKFESAPLIALQKALLLAASSLEKKVLDTTKEKESLRCLYNDRIVSYMYDEIIETEKEIGMMRKEIMAEAQELRNGWETKIFEEARTLAKKKVDNNKVAKVQNDNLFLRKREVLVNALESRMCRNK